MRKSTIMKVIQGQTGLTATGWDLANINESQWNEAGEILVKIDQARQWWLGDWWNACAWGDGKVACERIGVNPETASNCGKVSRAFEFPRRHGNLTFSHHQAVTYIEDTTMQDKLLDWAEEKKSTVKAVRERVNTLLTCTRKALEMKTRIDESKIQLYQSLSDVRERIGDEKYEQWFQARIASQPHYHLAVEMGIL